MFQLFRGRARVCASRAENLKGAQFPLLINLLVALRMCNAKRNKTQSVEDRRRPLHTLPVLFLLLRLL